MEYKISLITPCYNLNDIDSNNKDVFLKSLKSVQNQTIGYENIEHILVDDCSTDGTSDFLDELSNKYNNIKLIKLTENTGKPSIPRNIGISEASSKYIMFLDQDDIFKENACEVLYNEIINNDVDMVNSNYYSYDGTETFKHTSKFTGRMILEPKGPNSMNFMTFIWTAIFKKDFLIENNIKFPNAYAEDVSFITDCILSTKKDIIVLNDFYSYLYISDNNTSISHAFKKNQIIDYLNIYTECIDKIISNNEHPQYLSDFYYYTVIVAIGSLLRSTETKQNKIELFSLLKDYLEKHDDIPVTLSYYWKIMVLFIKHDQKTLFFLSSDFIQKVFEQNWFRRMFRNQSYTKDD